jgi:uncharacterized repeat protein (TIGR01451 family)
VQIYNTALTATQITNLQTSLAAQIMATTDERGDSRRVGGGLDIGADEYQYNLVVTGSAPGSVPADDLITYTLTVTNDGPDPVNGVTLIDIPPQYVDFLIASPPGWNVSAPAGGPITAIDSSTLPSGGTAQFTLIGDVGSGALNYAYIYNTATAGPSTEDATPSSSTLMFTTDVPNGLGILSQPATGTIGEPLGSAVTVNVVDNANNTVTTDNTQIVTLSIASGPAGATLSGTTTATAVNGVATFSGLSLNLAGTYTLVATGGDLTPVYTSPIQVAPVPITSGLSIRREPLHKVAQKGRGAARTEIVRQKVIIKNTSRKALTGAVGLEINGLPAGDTITNASGSIDGVPYVKILSSGKSLDRNHSVTVSLDFSIDGKAPRNLNRIYKNIEAMLGL